MTAENEPSEEATVGNVAMMVLDGQKCKQFSRSQFCRLPQVRCNHEDTVSLNVSSTLKTLPKTLITPSLGSKDMCIHYVSVFNTPTQRELCL